MIITLFPLHMVSLIFPHCDKTFESQTISCVTAQIKANVWILMGNVTIMAEVYIIFVHRLNFIATWTLSLRRHGLYFQIYQWGRDFKLQKMVWGRLSRAFIPVWVNQAPSTRFLYECTHCLSYTDYCLNSSFYLACGDSLPTFRASTKNDKNPREAPFGSCQPRRELEQKTSSSMDSQWISAFIFPSKDICRYFSYAHCKNQFISFPSIAL